MVTAGQQIPFSPNIEEHFIKSLKNVLFKSDFLFFIFPIFTCHWGKTFTLAERWTMMTSWAEWDSSCITAAWNITCIIFIYIHLLIYYIYLDISRLLTQKLDVNWKDVYYQEARRRKAKTKGKCWKDRLMKNWVEGPDLCKSSIGAGLEHHAACSIHIELAQLYYRCWFVWFLSDN